MRIRLRTAAANSITRVAVTAIAAGGMVASVGIVPAAAAEGDPTVLTASVSSILTLPDADDFNDASVLTVTSDAATTVQPQVLDAALSPVGLPLAAIPLTDEDADGTFTGSLPLTHTALSLPAGDYTVQVTDTVLPELTATDDLTIGSGHAVAVSLATTPSKVFPHKDGYLDTLQATVEAVDETGTSVPFDGYVRVTSGTKYQKPRVKSTTGAPATITISVAGYPVGTGSVFARVHGNAGPNADSPTRSLALSSTLLSSVTVTSSVSTIYPAVDGYKDTAAFTFSAATSTGKTIPVSGTVKVYYGSKLVKSWSLTSSKTKAFTWNGLYGGKLVPGKYTVKVSAKGPQGGTKTASLSVNVSKKKLVTKTYSKMIDAADLFDEYEYYGAEESGCFLLEAGKVGCVGADGVDAVSLYAYGGGKIPTAVQSAVSASVKVTVNVDHVDGNAAWGVAYKGNEGEWGFLSEGNSALGWLSIKKGTTHLFVDFWLDEYSELIVDQYLLEYRYKVLA